MPDDGMYEFRSPKSETTVITVWRRSKQIKSWKTTSFQAYVCKKSEENAQYCPKQYMHFFCCKHNKGRDSKKKRISILTFSDYEFRIFFKVSVALNKPASRKIAYLQRACPVSAPSHAVVYRWVKHFSCANLQLRRPGVKGGGGGLREKGGR